MLEFTANFRHKQKTNPEKKQFYKSISICLKDKDIDKSKWKNLERGSYRLFLIDNIEFLERFGSPFLLGHFVFEGNKRKVNDATVLPLQLQLTISTSFLLQKKYTEHLDKAPILKSLFDDTMQRYNVTFTSEKAITKDSYLDLTMQQDSKNKLRPSQIFFVGIQPKDYRYTFLLEMTCNEKAVVGRKLYKKWRGAENVRQ